LVISIDLEIAAQLRIILSELRSTESRRIGGLNAGMAMIKEIPIKIIGHPDRRSMAERLAEKVDGVVSWHSRGRMDHLLGCALNHLDALKSFLELNVDWVVCLEDDAVPLPEFRRHLSEALEYAPAPVVGLYLGTGNPSGEAQRQIRQAVVSAEERGHAWLLADCLIGSVGYALEAHLLEDMIEFIEDRDEELPLRISRWAQDRKIPICYTQPSLVDHADVDSIGRPWRGDKYTGRKAWNFSQPSCWYTGTVQLGHCPVWSAPKEEKGAN